MSRVVRIVNLGKRRQASVSVMAALLFPVILGFAGLVLEYGDGLLIRQRAQRVADMTAFIGAVNYAANGSTSLMQNAVSRLATLNGQSSSAVSPSVVTSPTGDGNQAVLVKITNNVPLAFASLIRSDFSLPVTAASYMEINPGTAACILALSSTGAGINLSGGTSITAKNCTVASNNTISDSSGTSITSSFIYYNSATAPDSTTQATFHAPSGGTLTLSQKATANPLASNSEVTTATGRLATVAAMTSPAAPSVTTSSADLYFASWQTSFTAGGCTGTASGKQWTFTCPAGSTFTFGSLFVDPNYSLNFKGNGSASTTYNFSGTVNNNGNTATFPAGNYNMAQGLFTTSGTTTFGAGTYKIGSQYACSTGSFSIGVTGGSLTISGPLTLVTSCGIDNTGSGSLALGSGSTSNSYKIGYSTVTVEGNVAVLNGSGATVTLGDATGSGGVFQANGMIDLAGGASCTTLPAATQHDVNGSIVTDGDLTMGAGIYTFNGYINFGAGSGGATSCNGSSAGVYGSGVTLVYNVGNGSNASGTTTGSACAGGDGFCVGNGFSNITLTAPTSGSTQSLLVVGPTTSSNTAGLTFTQGATNTSLSGVFYAPYAPLKMSGGASIGNGTGQCLELIVASVKMTGGTAIGDTCPGLPSQASGGKVSLVQ